MISQRAISLLANAVSGDNRISDHVIERDYCLAWFLVGLANSPLRDDLVFKGGTALKRCYFIDYRFSEDMDFVLGRDVDATYLSNELESIFRSVKQNSGITFDFANHERFEPGPDHCSTIHLAYLGPLLVRRTVKVDLTTNAILMFPLEERPVLRYETYLDLPDASVLTYSLPEMVIEKLMAVSSRNEPRDFYDLSFLLDNDYVQLDDIQQELEQKFEAKGRDPTTVLELIHRRKVKLKKRWEERLASQMAELPPFDHTFESVVRHVRRAGYLGR